MAIAPQTPSPAPPVSAAIRIPHIPRPRPAPDDTPHCPLPRNPPREPAEAWATGHIPVMLTRLSD